MMDSYLNGCVGGWMDGWMDGWMGEGMDLLNVW